MPSKDTPQSLLNELTQLSIRTAAAERRILRKAREQTDAINKQLDKLKPTILVNEEDGAKFRELTLQRGKLALVISRAQKALEKS